MKRYFLTGGMGFIGSALAKALIQNDPDSQITLYDNLYRHPKNHQSDLLKHKSIEFINADLFDKECLEKTIPGHDFIVHLVALAGVDATLKSPAHTMKTNIQGTLNVIEEGIKRTAEWYQKLEKNIA